MLTLLSVEGVTSTVARWMSQYLDHVRLERARGGNDRTDKASGQVGVAHWWWKRGIAQVEAASNQDSVSRKYENCKRDWGRQGISELRSIMVMSCQV